MCNILALEPGQMIPYENLANMCYNNWHSYGLVVLKKGSSKPDVKYTMEITKVLPEEEVNPDEVNNILQENIEHTRILHVRHNTAGATTYENTHPFDVYEDETGRKVVFMHNGTLYEYKSKKWVNNKLEDDNDGPSDTKNFVDKVLIPYTDVDFGDGFGDIENDLFEGLVKKFWPSGNRGILISNCQEPLLLGDWKNVSLGGTKVLTSNDDYFYSVKRGPESLRRLVREAQAKQKAKEAAQGVAEKTGSVGTPDHPYVLLKNITEYIRGKHQAYRLVNDIKDIINDYNVWDRDCAAQSLPFMTYDEVKEFITGRPEEAARVVDWIFTDYGEMYSEMAELETKKSAGEKLIATLKQEINSMKKVA